MASASATISSDPIAEKFAALRADSRRALVCYITAGHPTIPSSLELLRGLAEFGADLVEVGVPFSDPMADGPAIQLSSQRALANGMTYEGCLELIEQASLSIPLVLFTYLNPLLAAGRDALARARNAGAHGVLVTDLPIGADPEREAWLSRSGLAFVRLVAPTTPPERIALLAEHGGGFVYLVSRLGVTGTRKEMPPGIPELVARVRASSDLPVCVGFGISTPAQARAVAAVADGVVVGSAIVERAERSVGEALDFVRAMREEMDR